jgi:plasmid stability protein
MALLQVRNFPQDLYNTLVNMAKEENRSTAQQTIVVMRDALAHTEGFQTRRRVLFESLEQYDFSLPPESPTPEELVREDRDR